MSLWFQILLLFFAAYFGHLFTKWKFFRETLYSKKIDAYSEIAGALVSFAYKCGRDSSIVDILESFKKIELITQQSYLFLPDNLYLMIINEVSLTAENFAKLEISNKDFSSVDIFTEPASSFKLLDRDPDGKVTVINIFAILNTKIPEILKELKKDIGTHFLNTGFVYFHSLIEKHRLRNEPANNQFETDGKKMPPLNCDVMPNTTCYSKEILKVTEQALLSEIETVIEIYEEAIGTFAARTRQMIERDGAVNALSKLAVSADLQQGFKVLRDLGQLDQTFESLIVRYPHLFLKNVVEAAQWRLDNADELL